MTTALYHVPRSQVWEGSRGRQVGHVHLHVKEAMTLGRMKRKPGEALCKRRGWYERPPETGEARCPTCSVLAEKFNLAWPEAGPEGELDE